MSSAQPPAGESGRESIARNVGFVEPKQMYQVFCRDVGVPPTEYRRQRRGNAKS